MTSVLDSSQTGPRLSLSLDSLPSSSPFPSPSSSFLPPPMPGAHEFAIKPPASRKRSVVRDSIDKHPSPLGLHPDADSPTTSPGSPTPTNTITFGARSEEHESLKTPSAASSSLVATPTAPTTTPSRHNSLRDSLTSNRPAPPSPALSRRTSTARSTGSNRSRPPSGSLSLSRTASNRRTSSMSQSHRPDSPQQMPSQPPKRRSLLVKIRDFAFTAADDRHTGLGPDVPKPNRAKALNRRRGSTSSTSSEDNDGEEQMEEDDSWGGFKWGFSRLSSWGFGRSSGSSASRGGENGGYVPTDTDFARNFDAEAEEDEESEEYLDAEEAIEDDGPLSPGLYRSLYAFEPEGTAEMALEEDQIVRVVGRGGGVGWAIVVRDEGGHALVPESYLEPFTLDDDEDGA